MLCRLVRAGPRRQQTGFRRLVAGPAARGWRFRGEGFGDAEFLWKVPGPGRYANTAVDPEGRRATAEAVAGADGLLHFSLLIAGDHGALFSVMRSD